MSAFLTLSFTQHSALGTQHFTMELLQRIQSLQFSDKPAAEVATLEDVAAIYEKLIS